MARLGIPADLTSGSMGHRSLQDIAGMKVSKVFGSFFDRSDEAASLKACRSLVYQKVNLFSLT